MLSSLNFRQIALSLLVASMVMDVAHGADTANANGAPNAPAAKPASSEASGAPTAPHPITQTAVQAGVLSCAARINQVSSFLTANSQNSAQVYVANGQPDQKVFSASMEIITPNAPGVYASASFAPNQANGCGALYETVAYWPGTCDDIAKQQYAGLKEGPKLGQRTRVLLLGPSSRVFLMPAGTGCLSIKKEVLL